MSISSTRHAAALTLYFTLGLLGLFHVMGKANHEWIVDQFDSAGASLWATLYLIGPVVAMVGAWVAPNYPYPKMPLWIEGAGCLLAAATNVTFGYCMWRVIGFEAAATTQTLLVGIAGGMVLRFRQIVKDQGRMKKEVLRQRVAAVQGASPDNDRG